jgi:PTS system fructose-specific IIC component
MKKIVAVTSCPMGIAHTYMAAEMLQKEANLLEVMMKVETHGQLGIENRLTEEDIKDADAVIIASDQKLDLKRFQGKALIWVSVRKAITDASSLIIHAYQKPYPIYDNKEEEA